MPGYLLSAAATLLSEVLFLIVFLFAIECLVGSLRLRRRTRRLMRRPPVAILVPAHNEELQIAETLRSIKAQMWEFDRLLVVADNCTDLTAQNAREAGAEVIERFDTVLRGKGYALDAGIRHLSRLPPDVVVIVDADCWLEPGALDALARMSAATNRPIQSRYLMVAHSAAGLNLAISEFAFLLKNRVRLLGLSRLGLPAQLTGSGMAFPWRIIRDAELANGHLVEDMKLGLELARNGHAPLFCDAAVVKSRFPYSVQGLESQAARWNGGRFALISQLLSALFSSGTLRNGNYLVMIADALVPPLTLLLAFVIAALAATGALAIYGIAVLPFVLSVITAALLAVSLTMAWSRHGVLVLPPRKLFGIPRYAAGVIGRYPRQILGARKSTWIRTDRNRPTDM